MKVFISWSGERSKAIAEAFREWLPNVIQIIEPWMSAEDVEKGARWASDIASQLENSRVGVICLTSENLYSPWILFEAGALSKTLEKTYVCPYLFDVNPIDLKGPLVQFQATKAEKEDTRHLIHTINRALSDKCLANDRINSAFEIWWPRLEEKLTNIRSSIVSQTPETTKRSNREILEEILELAREERRWRAPRKIVGYCGVDTGQLIITDPAYLREFRSDHPLADDSMNEKEPFTNFDKELKKRMKASKRNNGFAYSYSGCCAATKKSKTGAGQLVGWGWQKLSKEEEKLAREGKLFAAGAFDTAGVAVQTGFGDGCYPVYVEYEGRTVKSVTVQFFE